MFWYVIYRSRISFLLSSSILLISFLSSVILIYKSDVFGLFFFLEVFGLFVTAEVYIFDLGIKSLLYW